MIKYQGKTYFSVEMAEKDSVSPRSFMQDQFRFKVVEYITSSLSFIGMLILFILLWEEAYSTMRYVIVLTAIAIFSRMVISRSLPFIAEVGVAITASVLLFYTAIFTRGFPQPTEAEEFLLPEIRVFSTGIPEAHLPPVEEGAAPLPVECIEGQCRYPGWAIVLNDVSGYNQRNPLKSVTTVTVEGPNSEAPRLLDKQVNVLGDGSLSYRFVDPGAQYDIFPAGDYTFTISREDGSLLELQYNYDGLVVDIPRQVYVGGEQVVMGENVEAEPAAEAVAIEGEQVAVPEGEAPLPVVEQPEVLTELRLAIRWQQDFPDEDEFSFDQYVMTIARGGTSVGFFTSPIDEGVVWQRDLADTLERNNELLLFPSELGLQSGQEYVLFFRARADEVWVQETVSFVF